MPVEKAFLFLIKKKKICLLNGMIFLRVPYTRKMSDWFSIKELSCMQNIWYKTKNKIQHLVSIIYSKILLLDLALYLRFDLFGDFLKHIGSGDHNEWKLADKDVYHSKAKKTDIDNPELLFSLWLMPLHLPWLSRSCLTNALLTHHMGTVSALCRTEAEGICCRVSQPAFGPSEDAQHACRQWGKIDLLVQICRFARAGKSEIAFQVLRILPNG